MVEHQYLELREQLKAAYRLKIRRAENGESSGEIMPTGKDDYGSFFGPSTTVLAPRLVQEINSDLSSNKSFSSINNDPKTAKTQRIKESRDYSFLLSDNQESKPVAGDNGQELGLEKKVSVGKSVGTSKKQNMPKGLPENKAKMQQRVKSEPESKTRAKFPEATPPSKLADVKKSMPVDQKQPLCRNSEKRPSKAVDQKKQPPFGNSKKRPLEDDDCYDEGEDALDIVRKMFNTKRFAGRDDSDRVMQAGFGDILKEEKRSERLGKQEDAEELGRILQEEEKERRQKAKRRRGLVAK